MDLAGKARAAQAGLIAYLLMSAASLAYDFRGGMGAQVDPWGTLDWIELAVFAMVILPFGFWTAALFRTLRRPRGPQGLPAPRVAAVVAYLFPLTLFFPWLFFRRAADVLEDVRGRRLATLAFLVLPAIALGLLIVWTTASDPTILDRMTGYDIASWMTEAAIGTAEVALISRLTRSTLAKGVERVFD